VPGGTVELDEAAAGFGLAFPLMLTTLGAGILGDLLFVLFVLFVLLVLLPHWIGGHALYPGQYTRCLTGGQCGNDRVDMVPDAAIPVQKSGVGVVNLGTAHAQPLNTHGVSHGGHLPALSNCVMISPRRPRESSVIWMVVALA
jgi:hypothetical protein